MKTKPGDSHGQCWITSPGLSYSSEGIESSVASKLNTQLPVSRDESQFNPNRIVSGLEVLKRWSVID